MAFTRDYLELETAFKTIFLSKYVHVVYPVSAYHKTILALLTRKRRQFRCVIQTNYHRERNLCRCQPFWSFGDNIHMIDRIFIPLDLCVEFAHAKRPCDVCAWLGIRGSRGNDGFFNVFGMGDEESPDKLAPSRMPVQIELLV